MKFFNIFFIFCILIFILILILILRFLKKENYENINNLKYNKDDDILLKSGLINNERLLVDKTRIWGDLSDDPLTLIQRMTDPGIEYEYNRINLPFYQDIIS